MRFLRCAALAALLASAARAEIVGTTNLGFVGGAIFATHAPGDEDRLFVATREGSIRVFDLRTNTLLPTPFLTIPDTDTFSEGGLLGLAFHPDYATNGRFYVNVTTDNGGLPIDGRVSPFSTRIREYTVSSNPDVADPTPRGVLSITQPRGNHNGGWIGFAPDGGPNLYIATGDGGGGGDPFNNSQDRDNLLGKVLRIDVDGDDFPSDTTRNYAIPADNPFVGVGSGDGGGADEIWSLGLRNPFRASFDRGTGDLWIGDVGQNAREEINRQPAASPGGENYGWNRREGFNPFNGGTLLSTDTQPVYDYQHGSSDFRGRSVTGGVVYRGPDPEVDGDYLFADFVSNNFWRFDSALAAGASARVQQADVENIEALLEGDGPPISSTAAFAEDAIGNVYVVTLGGAIFRIDTDALIAGDFDADGDITADDYAGWAAAFGVASSAADGEGDEPVNAAGYALWRDATPRLGPSAASSLAVPEPGAALSVLIALAMRALACRSRGV